ncbi:Acriflavine resistance protein B [Serratia fonticola]|uniref:Acriflavine resistance protein B n=1 Tax=Serratia fonticola TaxID=47917 RepID=A0A4U9VF82_SERFO|nr:Acriflavine resistance protein B [Serratia fonticola]
MSYQERLSGNQAPSLYAISLIVVFLCLAALYESWSIPFSRYVGCATGPSSVPCWPRPCAGWRMTFTSR